MSSIYSVSTAGYPRHRENRENGKKEFPVRENTGNLKMLSKHRENTRNLSKHRENTGNFVSSSCKCSDSKSKGYCDICRKKRSWIGLPSQFCVCNCHKSR